MIAIIGSVLVALAGVYLLLAADAGDFAQRLAGYMRKAAREGKTHTSWTRPEAQYEQALEHFVQTALKDDGHNAFLSELRAFVRLLDPFSALSALSLMLLVAVLLYVLFRRRGWL